ncbi:MAG: hypothetical protein IJE43_22725 [Alphaproteobacteria bacterium]|jgi:hypothetical protein|nr:hypothetical protein [Alphaproteobacteria bacterium]
MNNYKITFISSQEFDEEIQKSELFKDCKINKINGLTGIETTTIVLQAVSSVISFLSLIIQYETYKSRKIDVKEHNSEHIVNNDQKKQKYITVKGPYGLEFTNVPMQDLPELIEIIKSHQEKR